MSGCQTYFTISVELFYPIRGHSFMPCDRDFSLIKRRLRRINRLYLLEEIVNVVRNASRNTSKFLVHLPRHDAFLNFGNWWQSYYEISCLSNSSFGIKVSKERKIRFQTSTYHHMKCDREEPGIIECCEFIGGLNSEKLNLEK